MNTYVKFFRWCDWTFVWFHGSKKVEEGDGDGDVVADQAAQRWNNIIINI